MKPTFVELVRAWRDFLKARDIWNIARKPHVGFYYDRFIKHCVVMTSFLKNIDPSVRNKAMIIAKGYHNERKLKESYLIEKEAAKRPLIGLAVICS